MAEPLVSVAQLFGTPDINVTDVLLYHEHDDDEGRYRYFVTRASERSRKRSEGVWVGTPQLSPSDNAWLLMLASVNGLINGQTKNYHPHKEEEKSKLRVAQNSRYEPVEKGLGKFISHNERAYGKKRAAALARGEEMPTFARRNQSKGRKRVKCETSGDVQVEQAAPATPPLKPSSADKSSPASTLCAKREHCRRSFNHRGHCKVRPPPVQVGDAEDSEDETPLSVRLAACTVKRGSCYATRAKGPAAAAAAAAAEEPVGAVEEAREPEEPEDPPGFPVEKWDDLSVGQDVWALDCDNFWLRAKLTSVWVVERTARVHYVGWNARFDETLSEESGRLRLKEKPSPPPPLSEELPVKKRYSSLFNLNNSSSDESSDEEEVECDAVEAAEAAEAEPPAAEAFQVPAPLQPLPEVHQPPVVHSARSIEAAGALVQYAASAAEEADDEDDVEDEDDGCDESVTVASLAK